MFSKIIRNFIAKRVAGRSDDGIMITLKDPKKVDFQAAMMEDLLMRNGIDPRAITSEAELKMLLNQISKNEASRIRNTDVSGIRGVRSGDVVDMEGNKIPQGSRIMGGKQVKNESGSLMSVNKEGLAGMEYELPPKGSRGGPDDIAAPVQSQEETLRNMTEAEIKREIEQQNKDSVKRILERKNREDVYGLEDYDTTNMSEIQKQIIRLETRLGNLNPELPGFRDRASVLVDEIEKLKGKMKNDPEKKADGGRIGFFMGSRPATQQGLAALREMLRFFSKGKNRTGSDILKMVNPKSLNKLLNDPAIYNKFSVKEGLAAPDMIKNMQNQMTGERKKVVSEILGAAKNIQKADENTIKYKNEMIEEMVKKGADEETAKGLAQLMTNMAEDAAGKMPGAPKLTKEGVDQLELILKDMETGGKKARDLNADGGRIGLKDGPKMTRRTFLKYLTGLAAIPIVGKVFKPLKTVKGVKNVPIVKTGDAVGKPEWFDQLVNKVIIEGDDVTKKFATKEREIVHRKKIDEDSEVMVTQDLEDGTVRVDYDSPENMGQDRVMLQYKPGMADETTGGKKPRDRFDATEAEPRFVGGPEDADIEFDSESGGPGLMFLESDVSKLKQYATGKGPTMKEFVESKKRKDYVAKINDDSYEAAQHLSGKYGDGPEPDFPDDYDGFASGGIAGMLGE